MNLHGNLLGSFGIQGSLIIIIQLRGISAVLFLNSAQLCLVFVPVFHKVHLVFVQRRVLELQIHCLIHIFAETK